MKDSSWEGKERRKKKSDSFACLKKPLLNKTQCLHPHTSHIILCSCSMEIGVYSLEACGNSLKCIWQESSHCKLIWNAVQQVLDVCPAISQCITFPLFLVCYVACSSKTNIALLNEALLVRSRSKHFLHSSHYHLKDWEVKTLKKVNWYYPEKKNSKQFLI